MIFMDSRMSSLYFSIVFCYYFTLICSQNSTITSELNMSNFSSIGEEKIVVNLNSNCTTHEDCNNKKSICDSTSDTCECDITTMQLHSKCKTILCQSSEECGSYRYSSCTFGRCQCISGRKMNGICVKHTVPANPLPDWAIILIALSIALSVLSGGTLKKAEIRKKLLTLIRILLQRYGNDQNGNTNDTSNNHNENDNEL